MSIFKWSTAGLDLVLLLPNQLPLQEPRSSNYLPIVEGEKW